jgi:acyl-ACP thioesterase
MDSLAPGFLPEPADGRVYATRRIVRSTDVLPAGRLRLDALARYLQNAAEDDLAEAGLAEPVVWLVRRCQLTIMALPLMGEPLKIRTFCSATGPRWAERTTTISGGHGPLAQARAVWAAVSRSDGRPVQLSDGFMRVYGAAAAGRTVSARLSHPRPPAEDQAESQADGGTGRHWPLRAADFDTAGHVNNAVHWAAVEDVLAVTGWLPAIAEIEYHRAIQPGCAPVLRTRLGEQESWVWLLDGARLLASARLGRAPESRPGRE